MRVFDRGTDDGPVHALVEEAMAGVPGNEPRSLESWQAAKVEKEGWDPSLWLLHEDADGLSGVVLASAGRTASATSTTSPSPRARAAGVSAARCCCTAWRRCAAGLTVAELSVQGEKPARHGSTSRRA